MKYGPKHIAIGVGAFIFAVTASSVIGTVVNAVLPNPNKPDPEGKLDPDPQQKSKAEWLQQLEGGGPKSETTETKQEATEQPNKVEATAEQPTTQQPAAQETAPTPVPAAPPAPKTGPGNFDAEPVYSPPPVVRTGPGNM